MPFTITDIKNTVIKLSKLIAEKNLSEEEIQKKWNSLVDKKLQIKSCETSLIQTGAFKRVEIEFDESSSDEDFNETNRKAWVDENTNNSKNYNYFQTPRENLNETKEDKNDDIMTDIQSSLEDLKLVSSIDEFLELSIEQQCTTIKLFDKNGWNYLCKSSVLSRASDEVVKVLLENSWEDLLESGELWDHFLNNHKKISQLQEFLTIKINSNGRTIEGQKCLQLILKHTPTDIRLYTYRQWLKDMLMSSYWWDIY